MGGMAAALNKRGEDAVSSVLLMLQELEHRGADVIQVATPTSTMTAETPRELKNTKMCSDTAVGHNFSRTFPEESPPTILRKGYALAFEGRLFSPSETSDINTVVRELEPEPQKKAEYVIKKFDGSYTFAIALPNKIIVGRDQFGTCPLFFGENETICALASERKALWKLGIRRIRSFPPGNLATITFQGFKFKPVATLSQPIQKRMSMETAARRLHRLLLTATMARVSDVEKVAVAFSGGLDSSVAAVLAKTFEKKVNLVTVGLEGQSELRYAEAAAESLELPLQIHTYTIADVESALRKVLWLIEEPDVMKVGVAIPLFWAAHVVSEIDCRVLLAGQGADELFGGYHKYLSDYTRGGVDAVQKSMLHDLMMSYETNFQRDNPVCAFQEVELRLPYIDREVVRFALSLPVDLKIKSPEDILRKQVLRFVAQNMGIPMFIAEKTKKAVQYATGVDRTLRELARKKGLTQRDYVKRVFDEIYPTLKEEEER